MVGSGNYNLENKTFIIIAYTLTLRAMNAREVTQFHLVNIACYPGFLLAKYAGLKIYTSVY